MQIFDSIINDYIFYFIWLCYFINNMHYIHDRLGADYTMYIPPFTCKVSPVI